MGYFFLFGDTIKKHYSKAYRWGSINKVRSKTNEEHSKITELDDMFQFVCLSNFHIKILLEAYLFTIDLLFSPMTFILFCTVT